MADVLNWKKDSRPHSGEKTLFGDPAKFHQGLYGLTEGVYAWMQPNGSWGESNAGLITSGGESLVFDSLFDLKLTANMLKHMEPMTKNAPIRTLINSHSNGDHTYGNELFGDATIIASEKCAHEMPEDDPKLAAMFPKIGKAISCCGLGGMPLWPLRNMHRVGKYFAGITVPYEHRGITLTLPTQTFNGGYKGQVGNIPYELIEVGPAHTDGDILLYLPEQKVLFAGDILFIDGMPAAWNPGMANWERVIAKIQTMDVDIIVPGHGPITNKAGLDDTRNFFTMVMSKTEYHYRNGMKPRQIAKHLLTEDTDFKGFRLWDSPERTAMATSTYSRVLDNNMDNYSTLERLKVLWAVADLAYAMPEAEPKVLHRI